MDALYPVAPTGQPETIDGIALADVPLAAVLMAAEVVADNIPAPDPDWEGGGELEDENEEDSKEEKDDPDEDWDDDDWDDEDDEDEDEDEGEESEKDPDEEEDEDWDDEPPLESRFRVLTDEEKEERIRRKPTIDLTPKRSVKNHPPRGGVRRDASRSGDDEPPD